MNRTIKIHIAGQQYVLRSDADEAYVQSLADSVNQRIDALKGSRLVATQSDIVLAALKLADELHRSQAARSQLRSQALLRVDRLLTQLSVQAVPAAEAPSQSSRAARATRPAGVSRGRSRASTALAD